MFVQTVRLRLVGLGLAGALLLAACADATPPTLVPAVPSNTPAAATSVPAATDTAAPATAVPVPTDTAPPAATAAPPPPATATVLPASDTPAPPPTSIPAPPATVTPAGAGATDSPVPAASSTAAPAGTDTPAPAATSTPAASGAWQLVSPAVKDPRAALTSAADGTLYAGGDGVYRSTDAGRTWVALTTAFPAQDIAIAAQSPAVIYAGTGEGCASGLPGKLYRSTDHGATWTPLAPGPYQMQASVTDANSVLALRCDGVYRSADGGQTWHKLVAGGDNLRDALFLAHGVSNPAYLYAVYVSEGGTPAIQRSTDAGQTWKALPAVEQPAPRHLLVDPKNANHVYFLGGAGFLSSADGGRTWFPHNKGLTAGSLGYGLSNLALDTVSTPPKGATATLYVADGGPPAGPPAGVFRWNGQDAWVPVAPAPAGQLITRLLVAHDAAGPALLAVTPGGLYRLALH